MMDAQIQPDLAFGRVLRHRPPDGVYCSTPGGTRYQDKGDTKSLVARVVELEEKLKSSSAENAKAKQVRHTKSSVRRGETRLAASKHGRKCLLPCSVARMREAGILCRRTDARA